MKTALCLAGALVLAACAHGQIKVACVGDSNFLGAYPAELQTLLGPKYEVKAFGKEGASVTKLGNHQYLGSPEFSAALTYAPDSVVVLLGYDLYGELANNDVSGFEPAFRKLLEKFRDSPAHPKVYVWLFPDVPNDPLMNSYDSYRHPLARQAAREAGASVIESETFALGLVGKDRVAVLDSNVSGLTGPGQSFDQEPAAAKDGARFVAEILAPATIKARWRIVRASSFQADEGPPQNAIDGDPDTFWHSEYDPKLAKPPHEIVIDLGESEWLTGFKYLPRQDGGTNGNVKDYEIYVGDSPDTQTTLAAKGTFRSGRNQKIARFKTSVRARYLRFVCLSEENGQPFASAAELDVIRDPSKN